MFLRKDQLKHGAYYQGMCRNAEYARWDATINKFIHWRKKWGTTFTETICHPKDEQYYDVFEPFGEIEKPEWLAEIPLNDDTEI